VQTVKRPPNITDAFAKYGEWTSATIVSPEDFAFLIHAL